MSADPEQFPMYTQTGWKASDIPVMYLSLTFTLVMYLWETYLDFRKHNRLKSKLSASVPTQLKSLVESIDAEALANKGKKSTVGGGKVTKAYCTIETPGGGNNTCTGVVNFTISGDECTVSWDLCGVKEGSYLIQIHEKTDFSGGLKSAGSLWNPHSHDDVEKSAGHISKITAGSDGKCEGSMKSSLIKLSGEYSVLERYVMICADKDSGSTKNSVNTGGICIAYGGIQPGKKGKIEDGKILETLEKDVAKFRLYNLDKSSFGLLKSFFDQSFEISTLAIGLMPAYWDTASWVVERYLGKDPSQSEVLVSLILLGFMTLQGTIVDLPWSLYSTFVVEEKHGFNKTTLSLFIKDQITVLALTAVIGFPVAYLLINLVKWGGDYFYVYCWAFMFAFSILFMTVYPVYIQPLFNKYDPIEDGELKDAIYALAKRLNFPLTNLYQVDGSKRSSHSNAYLFGFGKNKRIVLFDTLIEQMTVPELEAVLGHEIGHWAHGHVLQMLVVQQVYFFAMFFGYGLVKSWEPMFLSFGFNPEAGMPTLIGLMLFSSTLWAPVDKLIGFLLTLNTRRNEFQADEFSVKQKCGEELKRGLVKMSIENRSDLNPDPLYSAYHYSHPPLLQRLSAIDAGMKKLK